MLAVRGVHKRFPGVHALRGVSLDVRAGEIHAVIGENGAGKSTLMRVLSGVHPPDAGAVLIEGAPVVLASPQDAFRRGIAMVWQDTRLVPTLDVAWNIALGHEPGGPVLADRAAMIAAARAALARIGSSVDPLAPAGGLTRSEMQQVEIARALSREARVLILDEPTSALTPAETQGLFAVLGELRRQGAGIVFVSHRLPEVMEIADRITVLRDGEVTGTLAAAEATEARLVSMMVGRPLGLDYPQPGRPPGEVVLEAEGLSAPGVHDLALCLRAGEIVGFGGIQGSGQQEAARALFGVGRTGGAVRVRGRAIPADAPAGALARGLVYVPADRRGEGLFAVHSIRENIALPHLSRWAGAGLIRRAAERAAVRGEFDRLRIRAPGSEARVSTLSGGNQQKVVFARWFLAEADVYLFDEPTQGVDVGTRMEIYALLRGLADAGAAVVVVSSDLPELIGLGDRILVFSEGRIVAELGRGEATEEAVVAHAVGTGRARDRGTADAVPGVRAAGGGLAARYLPPLLLLALLVLIGAAASLAAPYFLTPRNFAAMAGQTAPLAAAALGQMATIVTGGIDLSVGPTISLVTAIASHVLTPEAVVPVPAGVAICLAAGLAVGALNAALVALLRIPDLVATLSTFSIVQGAALILRPSPGGRIDPAVAEAIGTRVLMVPLVFLGVLAAYVAAEALLVRGRIGARLYATGASPEAAEAAGIPTRRVRALAYLFSGLMAAVAGLMIAARIGSGDPQAGTTFTLASVTAVVVGGTSVFGGSGTAAGTFLGAVLIILMQNVLNQLQVTAYWQYVWTGVLTLAAVGFHGLRTRDRRAAMRQALARLLRFEAGRQTRR